MATRASAQIDQQQGFATLIQWTGLIGNTTPSSSDVGEAVYVGHLAFLSVGYVNTSGTVAGMDFQGSFDGVTWGNLNGASALTPTGANVTLAVPNPPLFIRPANVQTNAAVATAFVLGKRFS